MAGGADARRGRTQRPHSYRRHHYRAVWQTTVPALSVYSSLLVLKYPKTQEASEGPPALDVWAFVPRWCARVLID